jgi:hypothetical protein
MAAESLHVRGPGADQFRRQRDRHRAGRHLDRRARPAQLERALSGEEPFDEATMLDEHDDYPGPAADAQPGRRDVAQSSLH